MQSAAEAGKKPRLPKCDLETEEKVISFLRNNEKFPNTEIAKLHRVSVKKVAEIRKKQEALIPWYQQHLSQKSADDLLENVIRNPYYDILPTTTNLSDTNDILPIVSEEILQSHTMTLKLETCNLKEQKRLAKLRVNDQLKYHGFTIFPENVFDSAPATESREDVSTEEKASVHEDFAKLLSAEIYESLWSPIFQYVQHVLPTDRSGTMRGAALERRMGDKGRMHITFSELLAAARKQAEDAERELQCAQRELTAGQEYVNVRKKARTSLRHEGTMQAKKNLKVLEKRCADAESDNEGKLKNLDVIEKTIELVCNRFQKICEVSPYEKVNKRISDANFLSTLLTKPKTKGQGIHIDSEAEGMSALMSLEKEQHVTVILNGFRAMRIINRIKKDREAAFQFVRKMLAGIPDWSDTEWTEVSEQRCWNFLCVSQFKREKLPDLQAVWVPIAKGSIIAIDNRTPHGGSAGTDTNGLRIHAYGFEADPLALEQDYSITIDLLRRDYGYFPVCHWAQTAKPPLFKN